MSSENEIRDGKPVNTFVSAALQLAVGALYRQGDEVPVGTRLAWNYAHDEGWFKDCETVGDMARAFLAYQQTKLAKDPLETLPEDCQRRIANLTERREHADTMRFTEADAHELLAWESYLEELRRDD